MDNKEIIATLEKDLDEVIGEYTKSRIKKGLKSRYTVILLGKVIGKIEVLIKLGGTNQNLYKAIFAGMKREKGQLRSIQSEEVI